MKRSLVLVCAFLFLPIILYGEWQTNFFYMTSSEGMPFRLFIPWNYNPARSYPLVLYLHYAGHEGTDNIKHLHEAESAKTNWMAEGAFVLCPQSTIGKQQKSWPYGFAFEPEVIRARQCLIEVSADYNIDKQRIYISGTSAGADGTWRMISIYTNTFAGAAPMLGRGDIENSDQTSDWAPRLVNTPIWAFSGEKDTFRRQATSAIFAQIAQAVLDSGGSPDTDLHRHTIFQETGHSGAVHDMAIAAGLTRWMFEKKLPDACVPSIITMDFERGLAIISWETVPDKTYRVQMTTGLPDSRSKWSDIYEIIGNGKATAYTNTLSETSRTFFRVIQGSAH